MKTGQRQSLRGGQSVDLGIVPLERTTVPEEQTIVGAPSTGHALIDVPGGHRLGVWEITPGLVADVEVDEVFVIISGLGLLEIDGGSVMSLRPGVLVALTAGMRTRWKVEMTLRKLYLTPADGTPLGA